MFSLWGCAVPSVQQAESNSVSGQEKESPDLSEVDYQDMVIEWIVESDKSGKKTYDNFADALTEYEANYIVGDNVPAISQPDFTCVIDGNALLAYVRQAGLPSIGSSDSYYNGQNLTVIDWNSESWNDELSLEDGLVRGEVAAWDGSFYSRYGVVEIVPGRSGIYDDEADPIIYYTDQNGQDYSLFETTAVSIWYSPTQGFLTVDEVFDIETAKRNN
jgi:hypothetical protein